MHTSLRSVHLIQSFSLQFYQDLVSVGRADIHRVPIFVFAAATVYTAKDLSAGFWRNFYIIVIG